MLRDRIVEPITGFNFRSGCILILSWRWNQSHRNKVLRRASQSEDWRAGAVAESRRWNSSQARTNAAVESQIS